MPGLEIVNVVYGDKFTEFFTEISLASQLSARNIPALSAPTRTTYHIYTTKTDAEAIRRSGAFKKLQCLINTNIVTFPTDDIRDQAYRKQNKSSVWDVLCDSHRHAIQNVTNDHIVFLAPDWVIADGTFQNIEKRLHEGYKTVVISGPRIEWETSFSYFQGLVDAQHVLTATGRMLVDAVLKYKPPIMDAFMFGPEWQADVFKSSWPSILIWQDENIGFISHSGHLHPIAVNRSHVNSNFKGTIDSDLLNTFEPGSDEIYFAQDSDEICIADISARERAIETVLSEPRGVFFMAEWLAVHLGGQINRWFLEKPFVFRSSRCIDALVKRRCMDTAVHTLNLLVISDILHKQLADH
ncbi:MAG: hypothetical protein HQL44_13940 [Alphaproteobacteria bacterium]|nr:hypothetical protein [Alphaproteobacteria bacterium]